MKFHLSLNFFFKKIESNYVFYNIDQIHYYGKYPLIIES
jgi:hypothetical protein